LPHEQAGEAWREVMARLRLPLPETPAAEPFEGSVACLVSPLGMDFAVMSATPQEISGRNPNQPAAVWLVVLLEGEATFVDGAKVTTLSVGDIVYGPTGMEAALRLSTPFRLLFISAPRVALDHRLVAPLSLRLGRFGGASGLGHVFSGLLKATAEALPDLTSEKLRPVELALTEFLVANLAAEDSPASIGGAEAARAAHFHRVCQTIETLLPEPDLSLETVAAADGISPRSLQKLFAAAGLSFSGYLRTRRLERCRLDLSSPISASLSISEICFRWGFNGSAHFSRAFKEQYGVSPRDFRKASLGIGEEP
jgi:AraC-like DNA-binding protein